MKTNLNFKKTISALILIFTLIATHGLTAQEKTSIDLKDFKVVLEKIKNGMKLTCKKGCAWKELTYHTNNYNPQAIDEYGMTEMNTVSSRKDPNLSDFLFILIKTKKGIKLKGIEGTAWTDLSFTLSKNKQQAIDQMGMAKLN